VSQGDETSKLGIVYALAERPSVQLHKDHKTKQKSRKGNSDGRMPFRKAALGEMVGIRVSDI
jgi:hypothetical protein